MWNPRLAAVLLAFRLLTAQPAPEAGPNPALLAASRAPVLRPGEGFAITLGDGEVRAFGEARREAPMGSLAKLVWTRLEGAEWSSSGVQYRCKGADGPFVCWNREGHGRVDLGRALQESCNLAFLFWIAGSRERWLQDYGPDAARARLEDVFQPFLGHRMPPGEGLPPLTPAWVGDGDLLRTSPEAFLRWLMEPDQAEVVTFGKRYLAGYWVEFMDLFGKEGWWFKTGTGPVPGEPAATSAWVAGGRGSALVVLHLPRGRGKHEGMVRIREILGLKP
ncbi:hypothetical protein [Geothrix oryzisoli]|uniref:hypothetical protein n=1 Tax=Geothrix oryzisoli TaxID=2922721 RepID=UPI001FAD2F74|nr:hypothetical protein [Geothrix oryzisoli]